MKILALDICGVLADVQPSLIKFFNDQHGKDLTLREIYSYQLGVVYNISEKEAIKTVDEYYETEQFRDVGVVNGSIEAVEKLSERYNIVSVTSRHNSIRVRTLEFMDRYFGNYINSEDIHFSGEYCKNGGSFSKKRIISDLGVSMMVDDSSEHIDLCAPILERGILFNFKGEYGWSKIKKGRGNVSVSHSWGDVVHELM